MNLPGQVAHSKSSRAVRAGAGNLTISAVGCAERRIARQRGYWSARVEKHRSTARMSEEIKEGLPLGITARKAVTKRDRGGDRA